MSTETEGIDQSNFFVVGIKPVGTTEYDFSGAELWKTTELAKAELEIVKSVVISGAEPDIFHVKVIGKLEKE